jgi:hypothetical protein
MSGLLLALSLPGSPDRSLLLSDANQHDPVLAFPSGRLQIRTGGFLFVLSLLEPHHRDAFRLGELMDGLDIRLPDLAEGGRGRDFELPLPTEEDADLPHRLELRHVSLKEDAVEGTTLERHPVSK